MLKKSITVNVTQQKAWKVISDIAGLALWCENVKETTYLSKKKRGIGTIRNITFEDNTSIEEHVVSWEPTRQFTYIATEGLPLRAYVATISLNPKGDKSVQITWRSYLNSTQMTSKQFTEVLVQMNSFYQKSLRNLKKYLELDIKYD